MKQGHVIDILQERGFIDALTHETVKEHLNTPRKVYLGVDPTADSVHLGNMVAMMGLAWFQRCGHTPVALVGGATGMIGDPSGKSAERNLLDASAIEHNVQGIKKALEQFLDFNKGSASFKLVNNYDWFGPMGVIDFLRDIGKNFRMGPMLSKDSVRGRLQSEEGMSFTEFSYQILQGYDFLYLFNNLQVTIQIGGSDQWGNITAGTDLIRRKAGGEAFGVTFPLLTRSDGKKFGKSESGTIWLDANKVSPYEFYQYLVRVPDADVIKLMRLLTFMPMEQIRQIEASMQSKEYAPNTAQKLLAEAVTTIVHGENGLANALKITAEARPGADTSLAVEALEQLARDMPGAILPQSAIVGAKLFDVLAAANLVASKGEGRRLIAGGGVSVNNNRISDENHLLAAGDLIDGRLLLITVGKKKKAVIQITSK